jgi:hypothetical protein
MQMEEIDMVMTVITYHGLHQVINCNADGGEWHCDDCNHLSVNV